MKTVLKQALKLLHPFMPFITEEIYSVLVPEEESLMMSEWPQFHAEWDFPAEENVMEHVKEITRRDECSEQPQDKSICRV